MTSRFSVLLKSLSPGMLTKALRTFDRVTLLIVSISWTITIVVMLFAIYTINLSSAAQKAAEEALVTEPTLPKIVQSGVGGKELKTMVDGLQHRYPDVTVNWESGVLTLIGKDGSHYRSWLMAIGQIDTLYPQFHWTIRGFCVGTGCNSPNLMSVDLVGSQFAFEKPQVEEIK